LTTNAAAPPPKNRPCKSLHAGNLKTFGFEQDTDLTGLIALDFDGAVFDRAAAATGFLQLAGECFDLCVGNLRGEIVNDNYRLAAAMRLFLAQHDAAKLDRLWRSCRSCR